jgi:hypothetical protein
MLVTNVSGELVPASVFRVELSISILRMEEAVPFRTLKTTFLTTRLELKL